MVTRKARPPRNSIKHGEVKKGRRKTPPKSQRDCLHPKGSRKFLGYATQCTDCGQLVD